MRKSTPKKRIILPDPIFNEVMVTKFVNHLMYDGKKNTSFEIFYGALDVVKAKLPNAEVAPLEIWKKALENITPQVEVKSRRVGGATFQVPTEIRADRKDSISMKNLILYSRKRAGTIIIDIIDDQRNILVWQGVGSDFNLSNISAKAERIPKAIEEILAKFPPQLSK